MKYNIVISTYNLTYIIIMYKQLCLGCQIFVQFVYVSSFAFNNTIFTYIMYFNNSKFQEQSYNIMIYKYVISYNMILLYYFNGTTLIKTAQPILRHANVCTYTRSNITLQNINSCPCK